MSNSFLSQVKDYNVRKPRYGFFAFFFRVISVIALLMFPFLKAYSMYEPDFAFPKDVISFSEKSLDDALLRGDAPSALYSSMNLAVARNCISPDSVNASIVDFRRVAARFDGSTKALALLLEASLYSEVYQSAAWQYNNRKLPENKVPDNVFAWDFSMFRDKILSLVEEAVGLTAGKIETLERFAPIFSESPLLPEWTVAGFVAMKGGRLLRPFASSSSPGNVLPFGPEESTDSFFRDSSSNIDVVVGRILKNAYNEGCAGGKYLMAVIIARYILNEYDRQPEDCSDFLENALDRFESTRYATPLLDIWAQKKYNADSDNFLVRREIVKRLKAYISAFPDCINSGVVKGWIDRCLCPEVTVSVDSAIMPGREIPMSVEIENLGEVWLKIYSIGSDESEGNLKDVVSRRPVATLSVEGVDTLPGSVKREVMFPSLPAGFYTVVPFSSQNNRDYVGDENNRIRSFEITDIQILSVRESSGNYRIYVVSAQNQKPVEGAQVNISVDNNSKSAKNNIKLTTSKDGSVVVSSKMLKDLSSNYRLNVNAYYKGSHAATNLYRYGEYENENITNATILTDLSVYRPGAEVRYSVVAYRAADHRMTSMADADLMVAVYAANGSKFLTDTLHTDSDGRASGCFTLPESGLLGRWRIEVKIPSGKDKIYCQSAFRVEEYKMPGFIVTLERSGESSDPMQEVKFSGEALTYSGMPVANAKVAYTVDWSRWIWYRSGGADASFSSEVVTDMNGRFEISLPTSRLSGTPYSSGVFTLKASVTDEAGETQSATPAIFQLGETAYILNPEINDRYDLSVADSLKLSVPVTDVAGRPVIKELFYELKKGEVKIASGSFISPSLILSSRELPSGKYTFGVSLDGNFDSDNPLARSQSFIVYRDSDKVPPVESVLWVPKSTIQVDSGRDKVKIRFGTSFPDSWILMRMSDSSRQLELRWIKVDGKMIELDVPSPSADDRIFVELIGLHSFISQSETITLIPEAQISNVEISPVTFRDSIAPGAEEKWSFRLSCGGQPLSNAPVIGVLSNMALNAIAPFRWSFNPYSMLYWSLPGGVSISSKGGWRIRLSMPLSGDAEDYVYYTLPDWNTHGYSLFSEGMYGNFMVTECMTSESRSANTLKSEKKMYRSAVSPSLAMSKSEAAEEEASDYADAGAGNIDSSPSDLTIRDIDVPVVFFRPDLKTDDEGLVDLDFTMANAIGKWQLQVAGYSPEMKGAVGVFDVVCSKRVMVGLNAPRYLRSGDKASIAATLYNNSDKSLGVSGRIELFDPLSGDVLKTFDFPIEDIVPSGSRVVSASFDVDMMLEMVGLRAYAFAEGASDGEQTYLPLLPAGSPVVESKVFFLPPGEQMLDVELPDFAENASVTLQYCDNPAWAALTALPALVGGTSGNTLLNVSSLFGDCVAAGLLKSMPELAKGLREFLSPENAEDSTLISRLDRNQELKTVALAGTPWVGDAASQTMRMESLVDYLDGSKANELIDEVAGQLIKTQDSSGGWSWFPGMKPSSYITGRALLYFSMLRRLGYFPEKLKDCAERAVSFLDQKELENWNKNNRKLPSIAEVVNFFYVRDGFSELKLSRDLESYRKQCILSIKKNWKTLDIYSKAVAAIVIFNDGDRELARTILESLRQYTSVTKERGMWYAQNPNAWVAFNPLITTTQVLEAFAEIEPESSDVDLLRQSILLSGLTEDWSDIRESVEVVNALLRTGLDWTVAARPAVITVDGTRIDPGRVANLTGEFKVDVKLSDAAPSRLKIEKFASGPSWGGVVARYVAPSASVKAVASDEVKIEKHLLLLDQNGNVKEADENELNVGDHIRVILTIQTDRNLEYVALVDERSACLEPIDKISGYRRADGTGYYQETANSATSLFFDYLPKGTHVFSYDCFVDRAGEYSLGIATVQSQLLPAMSAHSAGASLTVVTRPSKLTSVEGKTSEASSAIR